jgi:hypothetical protein
MKKVLLGICLLLPLTFFACGPFASKSPEDALRSTTEKMLKSGSDGDWDAFCDALTKDSRENLVALLQVKEDTSCSQAISEREDIVAASIKEQASETKINKVTVKDEKGRVVTQALGGKQIYTASLQDGKWRLDVFPSN